MPPRQKRSALAKKEADALRKRQSRAKETDEQRAHRLSQDAQRRANQTPEQRTRRIAVNSAGQQQRIANETPEQTTRRIAVISAGQQQRVENETPEQRTRRIAVNSAGQQQRIANETPEQRTRRIAVISAGQQQRVENETPEQRTRRIAVNSAGQQQRIVNETPEQRTRRIAVISDGRQQRVATVRNATLKIGLSSKDDSVDIDLHDLGPMTFQCESCHSLNFKCEIPQKKRKTDNNLLTYCCHKGKVNFQRIEFPDAIKKYIVDVDLRDRNGEVIPPVPQEVKNNFLEYIRNYNCALAFASMGGKYTTGNNAQPGARAPYCFRVQGAIHHVTSTVAHPTDGKAPAYAQLYMLDTAQLAADARMSNSFNEKCNKQTMVDLSAFMSQGNILAESYKMMRELEKELERSGSSIPELVLSFSTDRRNDQRRYNLPTANEIAVVFEANADGDPPHNRDLRVYNKRGEATTQLSYLDEKCDPMVYPLLFPTGRGGWHPDLKDLATGKRITQMQYYSHLLAVRTEFNHFLSLGKLTQQFIVDAYCKTEANRLNYIKTHQLELKVDNYAGLHEQLHHFQKESGQQLGRTLILPSSFGGGPRSQLQNFQDAMGIVRKFGKPDLFITVTCNPNWKEIKENLGRCTPQNRPDLISKVFNSKIKELLHDITVKDVLGRVIAYVYVIEFQKRGLPHLHMLVTLHTEDKPRTIEAIDKLVWAEIPDKEKDPVLLKHVTKHMTHGCSADRCLKDGKCSKEFPKDFEEVTRQNKNGYPKYQRRAGTFIVGKDNQRIDNSRVIPYNPWLLKKFNCHINVEICGSVQSVKYLYKYVYKGHDAASVKVTEKGAEFHHDEIKDFLDSRYVSAPEAMWRLNGYLMHDKSHHIIRLAVHLKNCQPVTFRPGEELAALQRAAEKETTLTAWFKLNQTDSNARQYLYTEIPQHYTFHTPSGGKNYWAPRLRGANKTITRMYGVHFNDTERYCLRMLLLHIRGAQDWDDLYKDPDGVICPTFEENCRRRHLLADDTEWDNALTEASFTTFPKQMRLLFAWICVFCNPQDAGKLFASHKVALTEDFVYARLSDPESRALHDIMDTLRLHGTDWSGLKLPTPNAIHDDIPSEYDPVSQAEKGLEFLSNLNDGQREGHDMVMKAVDDPKERVRCFFVDGPAGSGKTYLYNTLLCELRGRSDIVLPVASTGIAATLLEGGRTYHSQFKVPVPTKTDSVSNMKQTSDDAVKVRNAKLIVWDEAGMTPGKAATCVDRLLKEIKRSVDMSNGYKLFGNIVILFGGDFRQTLPIVVGGGRVQIVEDTLKRSPIWSHITQIKLTENMRAVEDPQYAEWLMSLGNGTLTNDQNLGEDIIEIPDQCICNDTLVDVIFPESFSPAEAEAYALTAILCPLNEDTFAINDQVLSRLKTPEDRPQDERVYESVDSIITDDDEERMHFPVEFLNTLNVSGMPVHKLTLKAGAIIMLLRNLTWKRDLCNGTRLIVTKLLNNVIFGRVISDGKSKGQIVFIPRMTLTPSDSPFPFDLQRKQFPVRVAFAMTINKAQGQTLEKVGLYLSQPVFAHGQLYTAFSRVKTFESIKVTVKETEEQGKLVPNSEKVFTRNAVYTEVL